MTNFPGRILLVDSNTMLLNLQKNYFSRQRINVASAQSAAEALKLLPALQPQVVILAYELKDRDGAACCQEIKRHPQFHTTPVLLLAPNDQQAIDRCWESGCDGVLVRPLHRRELAHVTQNFINLSLRAAPRIDTRVLVRFGSNGDLDRHDFTVNLSSGGLYLATSQEFTSGDELKLEFLLPDCEEPLLCCGRIAWINQGEKRRRKDLDDGVGIEFIALAKEKRLALQKFVLKSLRSGHS